MEKRAQKHWRRVEVLAVILAVIFVPAWFLTDVVPESGSIISDPTSIVFVVAPIVFAWLLIEFLQFIFIFKAPGERELSSTTQTQLYFFAWVLFIFCGAFVLYVALGDVEWVNHFYYQLSPFMRTVVTAVAAIAWLKLVPIIFYKHSRPSH